MSEEQAWELLVKKHDQTISSEEAAVLEKWLHQNVSNEQFAKEALIVFRKTQLPENQVLFDSRTAWDKVEKRIAKKSKSRYLMPPVIRWAAAATVIIGIIGISYWQWDRLSTRPAIAITTKERESKKIILPDGTQLWMNENTVVSYPEEFEDDSVRAIDLKGEAFLQVTHNPQKPFLVNGKDFTTRVLGTSFNVKLTAMENSVTVITGKVRFSYREGEKTKASVVIEKGYQATADADHGLVLSQSLNQNNLAWYTQTLEFKNEKLPNVVRELSIFYHVPIQLVLENPQQYLFTGTIQQASLEEALETICYSLHLNWKKSLNGYTISKK